MATSSAVYGPGLYASQLVPRCLRQLDEWFYGEGDGCEEGVQVLRL